MEKQDLLLKTWLEDKFKFLKEEKNLGAITWLTTVFATLSVAILKFIKFVSESGKLAYWKISPSAITVVGDNTLYDIILTVFLATILLCIFLIPYFIFKSKIHMAYKVILIIITGVLFTVYIFVESNANEVIHNKGWIGLIAFIIADLFFLAIIFTPSIFFYISEKATSKKSKTLTKKSLYVIVSIIAVVVILYFYGTNYYFTKEQTLYRITTDGYAIIYETNETYYLAKYDVKNNNILKHIQKIVKKENIEYTWTNIKK